MVESVVSVMFRHIAANFLYAACGFDVAGMLYAVFVVNEKQLYLTFAIAFCGCMVAAMLTDKCAKTLPYERFK